MAPMVPSGQVVLRGGHSSHGASALILEEGEPASYQEARASDEKLEWDAAMHREYTSLVENKTWELVQVPKEKQIVKSKWVYKLKDGSSRGVDKIYKARLVAKGYTQEKGVDYNEVFAPVAKYSTIRLICCLVAILDLEMDQMDVVTAFLYGELEEDIYMEQPLGYEKKGQEHLVCKLLKSIYGLKQSPRQWYKRFDVFMLEQGFSRSTFDPCVYLKCVGGPGFDLLILVLYVDDMLLVAKRKEDVSNLKAQLDSEFKMVDLGNAKKILGMEITRDREAGKLWLTQEKYSEKILRRFDMFESKPVSLPLAAHFKLSKASSPVTEEEKGLMAGIPYESAIGSLMYLMVCTRPDLAYAMSKVSRYMTNPGKLHWEAVKWMMRYLKGTISKGLLFDANCNRAGELLGYVDADHAQDLDQRRSTTGFVFTLGGGCISWKAILQKCVSQSSTEAEYVAAAEAAKEAIWLGRLVNEIGLQQKGIVLHCDSQSALLLAENNKMDSRLKHIDIRYHFIRDMVEKKEVILEKIDGKENPADALTKVIPLELFECHRLKLQLLSV